MKTFAVAGLALLIAGTATPRSSVLVVQVADAATNGFVADAQVRLPAVGRIARTRWDGEVQFDNLANGKYRIEVRAIGYAPGNVDVALVGDTLPVFFRLERVAATLDTVTVRAERRIRGLREFEERRASGLGRYFTDSTLADHRAQGLQLFLANQVPGLRVTRRGIVSSGECGVLFFLDGFRLKEINMDAIRLDDLAGLEAYTLSTAPPQYKPPYDAGNPYCRVILLWSKW